MSDGKRRALGDLYPLHGLDVNAKRHDWHRLFPGARDLYIEIGFGSGEESVAFAKANPEAALVGYEVYPNGVASALRKVEEHGLANLKVAQCDVRPCLANWFAKDSLAGVRVFFPDPWPKKRHAKRRLVGPAFVDAVTGLLRPGGLFHFATDWRGYATQVEALVLAQQGLETVSFGSGEGFRHGRRQTRFEARGLREGRAAWDLVARKNGGAPGAQCSA